MNGLNVRHDPYEPFAYAIAETTARVILLVGRGQATQVRVHYGDRYHEHVTDARDMVRVGSDGQFDIYTCDLVVPTRRVKYAFEVVASSGQTQWYGELGLRAQPDRANVFQVPYLCGRDIFRVPDWVSGSVCYQIFPDRFDRGDLSREIPNRVPWDSAPTPTNVFGGDLRGIQNRLDYLQALGVNLVYLTPIFRAASNHKYDTEDYFELDPQFGTKADLRSLVAAAHDRGIRILLDAVFNHCGPAFRPFVDVQRRGRQSPYWDWFFIDGEHVDTERVNYETFATGIANMPKLNVAHPEVEAYLLEVAQYWIRECDIDGWRLDVANEIDHVFWRKFRQAVKRVKPDALIIGEVWHNSLPWLKGDQFDGVMNYLFREYTLDFFVRRSLTADAFAEHMQHLLYLYPEPAIRAQFNLLGSHDTARILTLAAGDTGAVVRALVFQFTYPGIPMVYYGDEVGMTGDTDPGCRGGMVWDEAQHVTELQDAVRALAHLKRTHPALHTVNFEVIQADGRLLEYRRSAADGRRLCVAINDGDQPVELSEEPGRVLYAQGLPLAGKALPPRSAVIWE